MKQWFREGWKIHAMRAKEIYGGDAGPDGKREPYYTLAKKGGHLWTYGGKAKTMSASLGIPIVDADRLMVRLAGIHPSIPQWWARVANDIRTTRTLRNAFGHRIVYLGRTDDLLEDALAWIGQGTIACVANRVALNVHHNVKDAELLLQNHDSLVGQSRIELWDAASAQIREQFMAVTVPYEDPLVIPPSLKTSPKSWGDMSEEEWS
jgi:DNA polymerase I-like protein with 3'-5' exonuclease and polymerase domains